MPSYRYTRDIKPDDLKPGENKEYTKKEKARNWWQYHWYWVAAGLAAAALIFFFVRDAVTNTQPDYTIGVVTPYALPEPLTTKIQEGLAAQLDDRNGDGTVEVLLDVYTVQPVSEAERQAAASGGTASGAASGGAGGGESAPANPTDPYTQMAGVVRLSGAFEAGDPAIFLCYTEDLADYQSQFSLFGDEEGHMLEEGQDATPYTTAWEDAALLAGLDLSLEGADGATVDGQPLMSGFRVGIRSYYGTKLENEDDGLERWQAQRRLLSTLTGQG